MLSPVSGRPGAGRRAAAAGSSAPGPLVTCGIRPPGHPGYRPGSVHRARREASRRGQRASSLEAVIRVFATTATWRANATNCRISKTRWLCRSAFAMPASRRNDGAGATNANPQNWTRQQVSRLTTREPNASPVRASGYLHSRLGWMHAAGVIAWLCRENSMLRAAKVRAWLDRHGVRAAPWTERPARWTAARRCGARSPLRTKHQLLRVDRTSRGPDFVWTGLRVDRTSCGPVSEQSERSHNSQSVLLPRDLFARRLI